MAKRSYGPIEKKHYEKMNATAKWLDKRFEGYGFTLLIFNFGEGTKRMNYISNTERETMITAMKEFISNYEAEKAYATKQQRTNKLN